MDSDSLTISDQENPDISANRRSTSSAGTELPDSRPYDEPRFKEHWTSAKIVLPAVFTALEVKSIITIGFGVEPWLRVAEELGTTTLVGLDGNHSHRALHPAGHSKIQTCDLEAVKIPSAVRTGARFDAVICVDGAEHLTPARADSFISELCSLSDLVVFAAAVPGQGGPDHLNAQWPSYWSELFKRNGFSCFDTMRSRLWDRQDCAWRYLQTLLVFAREGSAPYQTLRRDHDPVRAPLPLIHPRGMDHQRSEFESEAGELRQLLCYQPFGRDEATVFLETRLDELRALVQLKSEEFEAERARSAATINALEQKLAAVAVQNKQLSASLAAMQTSTSWKITTPLRALRSMPRRSDG
jgi:hypothetical protein